MDLSKILHSAASGDPDARANLIQAAYEDLHKLATGKMSGERRDHTLTATALVHEVSLKLLDESRVPTGSRGEFYSYASTAMRNLLINHARSKGTQKRGGNRERFSFQEAMIACDQQSEDFLALNEALQKLAEAKPRKAQVVEMRYFGGLSNQEVAEALGVSVATIKRDWDVARVWLMNELAEGD